MANRRRRKTVAEIKDIVTNSKNLHEDSAVIKAVANGQKPFGRCKYLKKAKELDLINDITSYIRQYVIANKNKKNRTELARQLCDVFPDVFDKPLNSGEMSQILGSYSVWNRAWLSFEMQSEEIALSIINDFMLNETASMDKRIEVGKYMIERADSINEKKLDRELSMLLKQAELKAEEKKVEENSNNKDNIIEVVFDDSIGGDELENKFE